MSNFVIVTHSQSNGDFLVKRGQLQTNLQLKHPDWFVLNCAVGGATAQAWMPDAMPTKLVVSNYTNAVGQTLKAIAEGHTPKAIICVIGESNAKDIETASLVRGLLWQSLKDFRIAIGYPNLKIIVVVLGTKPEPVNGRDLFPAWAMIQSQLRKMNVDHPAYIIVDGNAQTSQYDDGPPYCHRTVEAQMLMADLVIENL